MPLYCVAKRATFARMEPTPTEHPHVDPDQFSIGLTGAAALLGVSRRHAYTMFRRGELPGAYRLGNRILIVQSVLKAGITARAADVSLPPVEVNA